MKYGLSKEVYEKIKLVLEKNKRFLYVTKMCDGRKLIKILLSVIYYILLFLIFGKIIMYELTFGIIAGFSGRLAGICFFLFPIILIISPIIWKSVYKKGFYKSILYSILLMILYLIIVFAIILGVKWKFRTFSQEKWKNYENLRYMMIDDFEQKYDLLEMTKQEVIDILGEDIGKENEIQYWIGCRDFFWEYYCLYLDNEGNIIETNIIKEPY